MEEIRAQRVNKVSPSNRGHNERDPGQEESKKYDAWRGVVASVNRQAAKSFSENVLRVLLAKQQITTDVNRPPERTPSPAEQTGRAAEVIPSALKKAAVNAAKRIQSMNWEKENR